MVTSNQISNCESIKELNELRKLRKLSARKAFQLPRTLRMLVRQDALEFELKGDTGSVTELYTQVSRRLNVLIPKVPPIYQPLIASSATFWQSEAEKVKAKKPLQSKRVSIIRH